MAATPSRAGGAAAASSAPHSPTSSPTRSLTRTAPAEHSVSTLLDALERELEQMAQAVVAGAPELLERHGPLLQRAVIALGDAGARGLPEHEQERLLRCASRLSQVRSNLSRRAAAVDRELAILMPDMQPGTYRALNPAGMLSPYR